MSLNTKACIVSMLHIIASIAGTKIRSPLCLPILIERCEYQELIRQFRCKTFSYISLFPLLMHIILLRTQSSS
jgi:hypothetical protein